MAIYKTKNLRLHGDFDGYTRSGNRNLVISLGIKGQSIKKIGTVNCDFSDIVALLKKQKDKTCRF